jgi:hypothetical protein
MEWILFLYFIIVCIIKEKLIVYAGWNYGITIIKNFIGYIITMIIMVVIIVIMGILGVGVGVIWGWMIEIGINITFNILKFIIIADVAAGVIIDIRRISRSNIFGGSRIFFIHSKTILTSIILILIIVKIAGRCLWVIWRSIIEIRRRSIIRVIVRLFNDSI